MAVAGGTRKQGERWSLAGVTALVTGGSKGIGHAIVAELAGFGAHVHTCPRSAADLEECRRRWVEKGLSVTVSVCDVAVRADRERLVDTAKATFDGKLEVLVNNAGIVFFKPTTEYTAEDYSRMMTTNLESCFLLSQLAHPLLRNASSPAAEASSTSPPSAVCGLTRCKRSTPPQKVVAHDSAGNKKKNYDLNFKRIMHIYFWKLSLDLFIHPGALNHLTRRLAAEWAQDRIHVNCVAPGITITDMLNEVPAAVLEQELSRIAMRRGGEPDEVASLVSFLCKPAA